MSILNSEQILNQFIQPAILQRAQRGGGFGGGIVPQQAPMESPVLGSEGMIPQQQPMGNKILSQPGLSQALLNLSATVATADARGLSLGSSLALGAQQFGSTIQSERRRIEEQKERQADRSIAAMQDLMDMRMRQEEFDIRKSALEEKRQQEQDKEKYLIDKGFDPELVGAFPNQAASALFSSRDRKTAKDANGILRYMDTGEQVFEGVEKKEKDFTDGQSNAALFATRMEESDKIMSKNTKAALSLWQETIDDLPLGNKMISDEKRSINQAQRDFVNAVLRRESGAAIAPEEFESAALQYFPQVGDDDNVIEQKRRNRKIAIEGIKKAAGGAYNALRKEVDVTDNQYKNSNFDSSLLEFMTPEQQALFK